MNGEALAYVHDREVRGLNLTKRIEADEIWSYCYAKQYMAGQCKFPKNFKPKHVGDAWSWVAIDPDSKLLVSVRIGTRDVTTGREFFRDLRNRIPGPVVIATDSFSVYPRIIDDAFGSNAKHVILKKQMKGGWDRETGDSFVTVYGIKKYSLKADADEILKASTSYVERHNGTIRNYISRFNRRTYRFSKKFENHCHAQAIYVAYYNFVKAHAGLGKAECSLTPAMKAGVTNRVWTYDDLLDEIETYWLGRAEPKVKQITSTQAYTPLSEGEESNKPHFVMFDPVKPEAKLHLSTCRNCQRGRGRRPGVQKRTVWYAFDTKEEALECARTLARFDYSECAICLVGKYRTRQQPAKVGRQSRMKELLRATRK